MSTAKRLVWSLRGRKNSDSNPATSSTHLVASGVLPAHELDEVAIAPSPNRNTETSSQLPHFNYGIGIGVGRESGRGSGGIADANLNDLLRHSTGKFQLSTFQIPSFFLCQFILIFLVQQNKYLKQ